MSLTDSRRVAIDTLLDIDLEEAYASIRLPEILRQAQLSPRDAAFATELVYGTSRLTGRYDAIFRLITGRRSMGELDPPVRAILRMAAHDMLALKTSPHAVVSQAVDATREYCGHRPTGFVNGVLRTLSRRDLAEWRCDVLAGRDGIAHWYSHPSWLVTELSAALASHGDDPRDLTKLLVANNNPPSVDLAVRIGDRAALQRHLPFDVEPTLYSPIGLRMSRGNPGRIREVRSGKVAVQDEGSQLMTLLAMHAPLEGPDSAWLDMCAGPGGKAGILAAEAARRGAHLVANEVFEHRAELVRSSLAPFEDVQIRVGDGREIGEAEPKKYDRILLDAPCTGTGSLRRRPEARWRKRPADLEELTALQRELLTSAAGALRDGGVLVYVTCSPLVAETLTQVRHATKTLGLTQLSAPEILRGAIATDIELPEGDNVQLWPHRHGTDAMFGTVFTR
ncbi:hypothetical protein BSZ39_04835 [Bowdeniella nasicola]|uniref:SAM-dependent MTase RsmB/NOP-type domain-containing protein n=1 Tax=Bowdeniella nasicola TaxID=208480 RepID=A0A1Q5Q386_9ACTO|nr:transcription antitermination factor NusB [Bowdeniella nasicola]OKL54294.1 hypothetical protein BSZ39_04835 [Bowdeniella nasicola]